MPTKRLLIVGGHNDLLRDDFNGSTINTRWVKTDTESKLSVSAGDLVCAGGVAAPGTYADPRLVSRTFLRTAGLTADWYITPVSGASIACGFSATNPPTDWSSYIGFSTDSSGVLYVESHNGDNIEVKLPYAWTTAAHLFRVVALATGFQLYCSTDNGATFFPVWIGASGTGTPLVAAFGVRAFAFRSPRVRVYRRAVTPAAISGAATFGEQALGATLITNGTMEADANWANYGAPTTQERSSEQAQAGTYSRKYINRDGQNDGIQSDTFSVTAGAWYRASAYIWPVVATSQWVTTRKGDNSGWEAALDATSAFTGLTAGAWNQLKGTYRAATTGTGAYVIFYNSSTAVNTYYLDTVLLEPITLSSTIGPGGDPGQRYGVYDAAVTIPARSQGGLMCCLDSATTPLYYLQAYVDRNTGKAYLIKVENGTTTDLTSGNVSYADTSQLRIIVSPGASGLSNAQVGLYYASAIVGTIQTVDLSANYGTLVRGFYTVSPATITLEVNV